MKNLGKRAYFRDLSLRSASSDRLLTWFLVDSSNSRSTLSLRQVPPDSISKPFPSSPHRRSSYMSHKSPGSLDDVNLKILSPTWITCWKIIIKAWLELYLIRRLDKKTCKSAYPITEYYCRSTIVNKIHKNFRSKWYRNYIQQKTFLEMTKEHSFRITVM